MPLWPISGEPFASLSYAIDQSKTQYTARLGDARFHSIHRTVFLRREPFDRDCTRISRVDGATPLECKI